MAWIAVITNAGAALLAGYAAGGHTLNVTGASVASGVVEDVNLRLQTALTDEKDTASIVRRSTAGNNTKIKVQVGAAEAAVGAYTAHQIGLWANLDGGARTLLALAQDAAGGVGVPTKSVSPNFAFALYITVAVSNTGEMTVVVDGGAFVTVDTLDEAIEEAIEGALEGVLTDDDIDDTAGAGDTDKLWSADKIADALADKLDADQGSGNAGKVMTVGADGVPAPASLPEGSTSQKGIVQLEDSTSSTDTSKAATPNSVKSAYDLANGKAAPSTALSLTLAAGSWSSATPPTQTITATGVTASNNIIVSIGSGATSEQYDAAAAASLLCTAQGANSITITAYGTEPTVNIPIAVLIVG